MPSSHVDKIARLDGYYKAVKSLILSRQSPTAGLFPRDPRRTEAWVRDNIYAILPVFGLAIAYRAVDDDKGRRYELEQSVVKCMRGLLFCMMRQAHKVEDFKQTQSAKHALHAKYSTLSGDTCSADNDWGHLQIDATALFILELAQMTLSGLRIIFTSDEATFVQNLVFYIERAYRTPDYGMWERGNKANVGRPELNASSIGMAKAALEAINGVDLFGQASGCLQSTIHVDPDAHNRNRTILASLLPRESSSKETDAALLSIIGFPAFALDDAHLRKTTRNQMLSLLTGRFGLRRFLRDGFGTVLEDSTRARYYESTDLKQFDGIECEWPLSLLFLMLDAQFAGDKEEFAKYKAMLEPALLDPYELSSIIEAVQSHASATTLMSRLALPGAESKVEWAKLPKAALDVLNAAAATLASSESAQSAAHTQPSSAASSDGALTASQYQLRLREYFSNVGPKSVLESVMKNSLDDDASPVGAASSSFGVASAFSFAGASASAVSDSSPSPPASSQTPASLLFRNKSLPASLSWTRCMKLVPAFFYVPRDLVDAERKAPGSQVRLPSLESANAPYLWSQAVYMLSCLLEDGLIAPADIDPCGRHVPAANRPRHNARHSAFASVNSKLDPVIQMALIAETEQLQADLATYGISTQTPQEIEPISIRQPSVLVDVFRYLGINAKLGMSGRPNRPMGALATSKLYRIGDNMFVFYPIVLDKTDFYMSMDELLLIDSLKNLLSFIRNNWNMVGRPTVTLLLRESAMTGRHFQDMLELLAMFRDGDCDGVRIRLGQLQQFISTSCVEYIDFLPSAPTSADPQSYSYHQQHSSSAGPAAQAAQAAQGGAGSVGSAMGEHPFPAAASFASSSLPAAADAASFPFTPPTHAPLSAHGNAFPPASPAGRHSARAQQLNLLGRSMLDLEEDQAAARRLLADEDGFLTEFDEEVTLEDDNIFRRRVDGSTADLVNSLKSAKKLNRQAILLVTLFHREGKSFEIDLLSQKVTVQKLLEELYERAAYLKRWSIVRQIASTLGKLVDSLAPSVTEILVRGKEVSLGSFGDEEFIISEPITPAEIKTVLYQYCTRTDEREAVLQQEMLIYLANFVTADPHIFHGMLRVRIGWIVEAMKNELARSYNVSSHHWVTAKLMQLSPFEIKSLTFQILSLIDEDFGRTRSNSMSSVGSEGSNGSSAESERHPPQSPSPFYKSMRIRGRWLRRRQLNGSLNRMPDNFYTRVWSVLARSPGISFANQTLPQYPTINDMTPGERNFAFKVETVLNSIRMPEYRAITVELLMVMAMMLERNPELRFDQMIRLDALVQEAIDMFWADHHSGNPAVDNSAQESYNEVQGVVAATTNDEPPTAHSRLHQSSTGVPASKYGDKAMLWFFNTAPTGAHGTTTYFAKVVVKLLSWSSLTVDSASSCASIS